MSSSGLDRVWLKKWRETPLLQVENELVELFWRLDEKICDLGKKPTLSGPQWREGPSFGREGESTRQED